MTPPKEALINGAQILQQSLGPYGFQFQFREDGKGSGGAFAWGEFTRGERKIELHFRFTLGMARYHIDDQSASHESYMRELNVWSQCRYPGFSEDAADGFRELTHDLAFANDFLCGDAAVLRNAAAKEVLKTAKLDQQIIAASVGDCPEARRNERPLSGWSVWRSHKTRRGTEVSGPDALNRTADGQTCRRKG